ncbi:MAG: glutathione synthase/ribosomal protein S6 modification enzyme (glutaminyl transferase) [Haloquadratum walsbyi J07HQW2]|jgi:Glutathione synthase/Ribosomal protein S6 modification enzyme (glutaminyl transferase)|uniref:Glutathione synthase/ribosomal protein S6 modification enzyme (Glutaminyl transferase) n=2 Tax=Haloquadratum walsbyi TaxID=293091 RepID=U1PV36_9EURY|nr:MAG: glutathione synthase/ribosomal protein S6 modification enzyme (glutaminyl transferase) [Haloquadratum walsbyi J07HQW2]
MIFPVVGSFELFIDGVTLTILTYAMLTLAVTTASTTFTRMKEPLADRDITVEHLQATQRTVDLTQSPAAEYDVGFVYPGRLMEGGVISARHNIPWVNGRDAIVTSRNKAAVLATLAQTNIPVPETRVISNPIDHDAVIEAVDTLSFPVVIKPNSATRGIGVTTASDIDSLLGIIDYLDLVHDYQATGDKSYLIQEFLPNARDYRVMVVNGNVVGGVERRISNSHADVDNEQWKHNVHRGATAHGVQIPDQYQELAIKTAAVLDINYLGVDILVTDQRAVVSETNARPTIDDTEKYDADFWDQLSTLIRQTAEA